MSILNHIKSAYNRVKTTLFHPKVNNTIKTVRDSVFLATLGVTGAAQASVSHNTQMSTVQQSGTSEFQTVKMYEVKSGDILGKIANSHNISLKVLLQNNPTLDVNGLIFPGQKIAIPGDVDKVPTDDNKNFESFAMTLREEKEYDTKSKKKSIEVIDTPPEYDFEIALKNGLSTEKVSMSTIFEHVKLFYPEIFESKDKKKIVDRFVEDHQYYSKNNVLNIVDNLPTILGTEKDLQVSNLLGDAGYEGLSIHDILKSFLIVETSAGLGEEYILKAFQADTKIKQDYYIDKAVRSFIGKDGDTGYYQITSGWLEHQINKQNLSGINYISNIDQLKEQFKEVIKTGIANSRTPKETIVVMSHLDFRFDLKGTSKMVGDYILERVISLKEEFPKLSTLDCISLAFREFNKGPKYTRVFAKILSEGGAMKKSNDLNKRLSNLNTFKIDNDMQITYAESKKQKNDIQLPTYLHALSTNNKVALALGQSGLTQSQADLIAAKYNHSELDLLDGLTNTLSYAQDNPGEYKQSDIKKLENLIAGYQEININEVANILGIPTHKLTDTQKNIIEKILKAPGGTPEEKLRMILLSTRNYFYNFAKKDNNSSYKELVVKLDTILLNLQSQYIITNGYQKAA